MSLVAWTSIQPPGVRELTDDMLAGNTIALSLSCGSRCSVDASAALWSGRTHLKMVHPVFHAMLATR